MDRTARYFRQDSPLQYKLHLAYFPTYEEYTRKIQRHMDAFDQKEKIRILRIKYPNNIYSSYVEDEDILLSVIIPGNIESTSLIKLDGGWRLDDDKYDDYSFKEITYCLFDVCLIIETPMTKSHIVQRLINKLIETNKLKRGALRIHFDKVNELCINNAPVKTPEDVVEEYILENIQN